MNTVPFDKGEVEYLRGVAYSRRAGYFVLVSILVLTGTGIAVAHLLAQPLDTLPVLAVALVATSLGANTGLHMLFTHRTFRTGRVFRTVLACLGTLLCQDGVVQWVANHKRHHRHVDVPGRDPHTPLEFGRSTPAVMTLRLLWASAGWKFSRVRTSRAFYARDLLRDPVVAWFDRHFVWLSLSGLALPFATGWLVGGWRLGLEWFACYGAFRVFVGFFFTEFVVNGLCHAWGSRKFDIRGNSRNIVWMAPLTFGATLHHNHHAFPRVLSPAVDGEWDPMGPAGRLLHRLGVIELASGPSDTEVQARRRAET